MTHHTHGAHETLTGYVYVVVFVAIALAPAPVSAQELFPRFDFHLDGKYVTSDDDRFNWIFSFGGNVDVVRAGRARAAFVADFEAIAGQEFRRFDVNQGNYLLEGVLLFKAGGIEVGPVWHHVSRHLSDRPKRNPIDWNMLSVRARSGWRPHGLDVEWQIDARKTVTSVYVDYDWEVEAAGRLRHPLASPVDFVASGGWRVVGVDGSRMRGSQAEGRVEVGFRLEGRNAAAELFAGAERRLDPYPLEFGAASWFLAGLRLMSR